MSDKIIHEQSPWPEWETEPSSRVIQTQKNGVASAGVPELADEESELNSGSEEQGDSPTVSDVASAYVVSEVSEDTVKRQSAKAAGFGSGTDSIPEQQDETVVGEEKSVLQQIEPLEAQPDVEQSSEPMSIGCDIAEEPGRALEPVDNRAEQSWEPEDDETLATSEAEQDRQVDTLELPGVQVVESVEEGAMAHRKAESDSIQTDSLEPLDVKATSNSGTEEASLAQMGVVVNVDEERGLAEGEEGGLATSESRKRRRDASPGRFRRGWRRATRTPRRRVISFVLLGILLLGVLVPVIEGISYGIHAYSTYDTLKTEAYGGMRHLLNIKDIFNGVKAHPTGFLDTNKLKLSQRELTAARTDFEHLGSTIDHSDVVQTVTTYFPQYIQQVSAARTASRMGIDIANIGQKLVSTALVLAPQFRGPLLTSSDKPLVTQEMLDLIGGTINTILPEIHDIEVQSHNFSFDALPGNISASQRAQLISLFQALPQAESDLTQVHELLGGAGWLLGVNETRTFLVQTMDRAELRPTGGFTGQLGELKISGGRVGQFSLKDISAIEYVDTSPTIGQSAPKAYRSWWPIANWGLRDSNLSADFPTSAQIAINSYKYEVGQQVEGVILFTPFFVEHILDVIGPITITGYNDTITSQNLEERLHYYQQDNSGIRKQEIVQHVDPPAAARKLFTGLLAKTLMDHVRHAPPDEIIAIAREALHDLKTKDLQVYVTNPQIENVLAKYGFAAQIDRSADHDGLLIVQANVNASKNSQYVRTLMHDTVTLDAKGGAHHNLQLRLAYTQTGPVYGYDAYREYMRIYVPPNSQFISGTGFDTGEPLCGGPAALCSQTSVYPHDELVCPLGQFQPGAMVPSIADPDGGHWHALDTIGPPTNMQSDEPGRAMFGGWVVIPKNCTLTMRLSWYVPPLKDAPYTLLVQRQAGTFPELDLTVLPTSGSCVVSGVEGLHFDDLLTEDQLFVLKKRSASASANCYPHGNV